MQPTYDTHCPVCHEPITVTLEPGDHAASGYFLTCDDHPCVETHAEAFGAWAERLEDHSPEWWADALREQQHARNVAAGIERPFPLFVEATP